MHINSKVAGKFKLQVRKKHTHELVRDLPEFSNLITDFGLNKLGTSQTTMYCYVGTGTTPAATTDTKMRAWKATKQVSSRSMSRTSELPYWNATSFFYQFAPGEATGNLTEVGIGISSVSSGAADNYLWSRELIVDGSGNPTALTVLADEYLSVAYTLYWYPPLNDFTGSVILGGITYNYRARAANITTWSTTDNNPGAANTLNIKAVYAGATSLGPVTGSIVGASSSYNVEATRTDVPYVNGSYTRSSRSVYTPAQANLVGGIRAILVGTYFYSGTTFSYQDYQIVFDKPIPKNSTVGLTMGFSYSWRRYAP